MERTLLIMVLILVIHSSVAQLDLVGLQANPVPIKPSQYCCDWTQCKPGWAPFNGSCYRYHKEIRTADSAEEFCHDEGGHLVSINSTEEHQFVYNLWISGGLGAGDIPRKYKCTNWELHQNQNSSKWNMFCALSELSIHIIL